MREALNDEFTKLLSGPLPGRDAQWLMAPLNRRARVEEALHAGDVRESAVMLLINPFTETPSFYLIERQGYDGHHSGQISLPGGKKEDADIDFWQTALRETSEELGLPHDSVMPLGQLTELFIPVSRFWVYPKLGLLRHEVNLTPDSREVKQVFCPALIDLMDDKNRTRRIIQAGDMKIQAPAFILNDKIVWGATAMILSEFSELIRGSKILRNT